MIAIFQKNKIIISMLLIVCLLIVCLCSTVTKFQRASSLTETIGIDEIKALQSSLLDLQNQDGGFSDKVVPDFRKQLYDSYYAVKTLDQLGYDLDQLKHTKEWIKTINIQNQILSQEDCVIDLILYIVGLYDLLDLELLPTDERAIEKFLQSLQSKEGYFYGTIEDRDTDTIFMPYQNTDILTATHTICEIFNILKRSPSFLKSLKIFNDDVLQTIENGIFDINQLEMYIVALKINALLTEINSDYIPAQSSGKLITEEEWKRLTDSDEMTSIFQLNFLYECYKVGKIGSEEQLDSILNKLMMLLNERGGFYVSKNGTTNAQADYIGVKVLQEHGVNLDEAFKEATVISLLDKQYSTGYFSYGESVSSIYNSYYAAKALALLPDAQMVAKNGLEEYSNWQIDQLLKGKLSSAEDQIFTILLAQALNIKVSDEMFNATLEVIEKNWKVETPEYNLMTLRYYIQALEKADMSVPLEWKELILKWYSDYNEHKTALSGVEKILQIVYLYDVGDFLQKEGVDFQFNGQEMENSIQQALDDVPTTAWKNIVFLNELIGFYEKHKIPLTFTNELPSMENLYAIVEEDLNVMLSVELIYNLLQYNMYMLPINTSDAIYEYMSQRGIENQQSFKGTQTVRIKDDSFFVETYDNLFRNIVLIKNENTQDNIIEIETAEKGLKEILDINERFFITEGVYQSFEKKSAYSNQNYGLCITGKWYSNGDVLALCNEKVIGYNLASSDHKALRFTQTLNFKMYGRTEAEIYGLDYKINKNTNNLIKVSENYDNYDIVFLTEHVPIIIKPKAFGFIQKATYAVTMDYGYGGNYATMSVESIWER